MHTSRLRLLTYLFTILSLQAKEGDHPAHQRLLESMLDRQDLDEYFRKRYFVNHCMYPPQVAQCTRTCVYVHVHALGFYIVHDESCWIGQLRSETEIMSSQTPQ